MSDVKPCPCGCGQFINGPGADVPQTAHARARSQYVQPPIGGRRNTPAGNIARGDFGALQQFPRRPTIGEEIGAANAGATPTTIVSLPGRQPPPGWDGENDARSPHADTGVS